VVLTTKQLSKKILAIALSIATMVAFMPIFGNFAYAAGYDYHTTVAIPDQTWTGEFPDLTKVDELAAITVEDGLVLERGTDYDVKADSADVGDANAVFTTKGKYAEKTIAPVSFKIVEPAAAEDTYTAEVDTTKFIYDGNELTAEEVADQTNVVKNGNTPVDFGTAAGDYSVVVTPEKTPATGAAGEKYQVVIKINGATPDKDVKIYDEAVTIAKANLKDVKDENFEPAIAEATYDGKAQEPAVSAVTVNGVALEAAEYSVAYSNNINAGKKAVATITATSACKNYTGSKDANFEIAPLEVAEPFLDVASPQKLTYTGKVQTPDMKALGVKVYVEDSKLAAEVPAGDYVVEPVNAESKNVGKYQVTIKASESKNVTFGTVKPKDAYEITAADMSKATVTKLRDAEVGTDILASAEEFAKYFKVMLGDVALKAGVDFDAAIATGSDINKVGDVNVDLTGKGNMTGKATGTYKNEAKKLAANYTSAYSVVFDGSAQRPNQDKLGALTRGEKETEGAASLTATDYNVLSWSANTNVGEAVVEIEGKGAYEGQTAKATFNITEKAIGTGVTATGIANGNYYVGCEITGATVALADKTALKAEDCTVTAKTIADGYLTEITVTGKGNYKGTCDVDVSAQKITSDKLSLNNAVVEGDIPAGLKAHDGATLQNFIKVKVGNTVLTNDVYTVAATGEYALGKDLELKLTPAKDEITGTTTVTKTVKARDIAELEKSATLDKDAYTYSGEKNEPAVAVAATELTDALVAGKDFEVAYKDNIDAGTATATITGKGNYTGSFTKEYKINKYELTAADFALVEPAASKRQFEVGAPADLSKELTIEAAAGTKFKFAASDYTISQDAGQEVKATDKATEKEIVYTVTINKNSANYIENAKGFKVSYTLVAKTVKDAKITIEKSEFVYDNKGVYDYGKLEVVVDGVTLTEGTDYTAAKKGDWTLPSKVTDRDYVTPYVEITFKGNYAGVDNTTKCSIIAGTVDLTQIKLIAPTESKCVYTGAAIEVTANDIGKDKLDPNSWTVKYTKDGKDVAKAIDVGTYKATVWSTADYGNKEGESVEFTITPKKLTQEAFEEMAKDVAVGAAVEYLGEATKAPVLSGTGADQFEVVEYDKTWDGDTAKKGTAKIALKDGANYSYDGTATVEFTWKAGTVKTGDVNDYFEIPAQVYTGKAIEPAVQVKEGCEFSADWVTVKYYENNVNAAKQTAKAYVEVKSPATETRYNVALEGFVVFTINPAPIADQTITVAKATYAGKAVAPKVTIKDADGALLDLDKDYKVAYKNNTKAGKGTATITGIKNYTGETDVQFTINKGVQKITKVTPASKTYKANAKTKKLAKTYKFTLKATATPAKGGGKVTFKKANKVGGAKVVVAKTGKVTVKKGLKKGTYKVKVKATKAANANYKVATKTVTVKITVR
jgi:hypothetical protein